jgi:glucosamine-6-phosphate deaminase
MRLIILDEYDRVSEWAAKYIKRRILHSRPGPGRFFTLGLLNGKELNAI